MRRASVIWLTWLFLVVLAACGPVSIPTSDATPTRPSAPTAVVVPTMTIPIPTPTAAPSPTPTVGLPQLPGLSLPEGGSITVGVVASRDSDVNTMPAFLQSALYDSLLRPNPISGALEPGLAESYQVSDDSLTMVFRLRPNIRWHNSNPLTAADVVATINAFNATDFRGTPVTDFGTLKQASAPDDRTVQLTFTEAYCPALASIGTMKILPRAVAVSSNFPELKPEQWIGTGPLQIQSTGSNRYALVPNPSYYRGAAHINVWTLRLYPDAAALRNALASKEIDIMDAPRGEYARISKLPETATLASNAPEVVTLLFNLDTLPLNDVRVRQALTFAVNRDVLMNDIAKQGVLVDGNTLPGYWANPSDLPHYSFDLARARQMLGDAGYRDSGDGVLRKDGKPMALELWTEADDPILEPLAFRLREMYATLGVQIKLQLDDRPGWVTRAFSHRFDLLLTLRKIPLDLDQRWYWQADQNAEGSGFNFGSYSNARVDAIFKESQRVGACNPAARGTLFGEMQRQLITDPPAAFLLATKQYLVYRDRVLGLATGPFSQYWNLNDWHVKP